MDMKYYCFRRIKIRYFTHRRSVYLQMLFNAFLQFYGNAEFMFKYYYFVSNSLDYACRICDL